MSQEPVVLSETECVAETDAALLCWFNGEELWVPKSVIDEENSEILKKGDSGDLVVAEWWALKNNFEP